LQYIERKKEKNALVCIAKMPLGDKKDIRKNTEVRDVKTTSKKY
jgi:hypothetical protein